MSLAILTAAANFLLPPSPPSAPEPATAQPPHLRRPDPPRVLRDLLGRGETLSQILERNGRPGVELAAVAEAMKSVFDVRMLRAGTPIHIYLNDDAPTDPNAGAPPDLNAGAPPGASHSAGLDSVVIPLDADRRLAIRPDSLGAFQADLQVAPVREVPRTHVGCIEGSLIGALVGRSEDFSPLALELDRIYGGQIDFYKDLQPGDCVSLHFQTFERGDGSFRLGKILAAEFVNRGHRFPAIYFEAPDGTADYYDLEGKSLKRQFLRSPLKFTRISSGFTHRRYHPILKRFRAHPGIDYAAPTGTPVQAAGRGVVAFAGWKRGYGKVVEIRHGKVYETSYAHLSRIHRGIRAGARVAQGDVIGYVGSTGLSTGPHLDYRFSKNGKFVNPLDEKLPIGEPVAGQYVAIFAEHRESAMRVLEEAHRSILVNRDGTASSLLARAETLRGAFGAGAEGRGEASFGDD